LNDRPLGLPFRVFLSLPPCFLNGTKPTCSDANAFFPSFGSR
jgi:hypothetical protein